MKGLPKKIKSYQAQVIIEGQYATDCLYEELQKQSEIKAIGKVIPNSLEITKWYDEGSVKGSIFVLDRQKKKWEFMFEADLVPSIKIEGGYIELKNEDIWIFTLIDNWTERMEEEDL